MKRASLGIIVAVLILLQIATVVALTSSEAKQNWYDLKDASRDAQADYTEAKVAHAADPSAENKAALVDAGKIVLHAALNEAEAWLIWKDLEVEDNPEIPSNLKEAIKADVETNLAKIDTLRTEVDAVDTPLELGIVFLKMVGSYFELVADVARNTGKVWVYLGNEYIDTIEEYEAMMRAAAEGMSDNAGIIEKLDNAKAEIETAQGNVDNAEENKL